ncbi:MAG: amidohydrolase family protein [Proteobacteria bacterium]|nr:amidohydrolase family protein [Pseudomonadota bacterium]
MSAERVVIAGGLVLTAGAAGATRADILVTGDTITAIVPPDSLEAPRIDASDRLIIPGLVNAHTHGYVGLSKGGGDGWSLEPGTASSAWDAAPEDDEDRYLATVLSAVEMVRKGCTSCFDLTVLPSAPTPDPVYHIARAYHDLGMRAVVAPMVADRGFHQAIPGISDAFPADLRHLVESMELPPAETVLALLRQAVRSWAFPADQVRLGVAPAVPLHCSDALLIGCRDIAAEYGLPLQTHLAASAAQRAASERRYGSTLTAHLHGLGLVGPWFSGAHGTWLDHTEMALIARNGGSLVHSPGADLRIGNGIADMRRALAAGVTVGVGTDGGGSSGHQNMFEAVRLTAFVSRVFDRAPEDWIGAGEALRMATEGSAAVLGMADLIGRIAPGYKADLVFLDRADGTLVPLHDAVTQLVDAQDGSAVRDVMIGGRFVMRDGEFPGIDWPAMVRRAHAAADRLEARNAAAGDVVARLAPMVAHFCVGLGRCEHGLPRKLTAASAL